MDCGVFIFVKMKGDDGEFYISAKRLTLDDRRKLNNDPNLAYNPYEIAKKIDLKRIEEQPPAG